LGRLGLVVDAVTFAVAVTGQTPAGVDVLDGGEGEDVIYGEGGDDAITGGPGATRSTGARATTRFWATRTFWFDVAAARSRKSRRATPARMRAT